MKFLSGIRKKILIGFFLAIITLISTGLVAFYSLEEMLSTLDEFAVPDKSVSLMYDISADLGLISNYNRIYSISSDRSYQERIEVASERTLQKIDSLATLLKEDSSKLNQIDSLKILLSGISGESKKLAQAKKSIDADEVTSRLARQILEQVKKDSSLINDSSFIVKNTTSQIRESSFQNGGQDSAIIRSGVAKDINFFQKLGFLFSKKRPSQLIDTLYILPDKRIDTLTTVQKDSVIYISKGEFVNKLDSLLQIIQQEESKSQDRINQMELAFTHHNNEMLEKARSILVTINKSTIESTFTEIAKITSVSKQSKQIILFMIVLFVIAGIVLVIFVQTDISKSNYYQEELLNAKKISDASAKAKLDFLAKMSHEIRTPLTSILGFSKMLKGENNEYVKIIQNSSTQLLNTANEILDLAKVDSGIIEINKEPFDLSGFLRYLMLDYEMKSTSENFTFNYEIENGEKLIINSDELRLRQILSNILNNAFKFTEEGEVKFTCHHKKINENIVEVLIKISDTGIGINKPDIQKIFLDYEQAGNTALKKQGYGLGLGIVKKLVHLINGTMLIDSEPGKGTTFHINFKFELSSETKEIRVNKPDRKTLRGYRILIIDDDETILMLFGTFLKRYGAKTEIAKNPEKARHHLRSRSFDLCLMDLQLSGYSGTNLCHEIKSTEKYEHLKIIACTANLIGISKDELLKKGFDHIIFKPISEEHLIDEISHTLNIPVKAVKTNYKRHSTININESVDFEHLQKFTLGDDDLLNDIIDQFINDTGNDINLMQQSLKENDKQLLKNVLHRLSSRLSQFGIISTSLKAKNIEKEVYDKDIIPENATSELVDTCASIIDKTKARIKIKG